MGWREKRRKIKQLSVATLEALRSCTFVLMMFRAPQCLTSFRKKQLTALQRRCNACKACKSPNDFFCSSEVSVCSDQPQLTSFNFVLVQISFKISLAPYFTYKLFNAYKISKQKRKIMERTRIKRKQITYFIRYKKNHLLTLAIYK